MHRFNQKLKLIFLPYLLIVAVSVVVYSFLNWLLIIQFKLFAVDDFIVNGAVPVGFVFLNLTIWLRPRLMLLKLKTGYRKDPLLGLIMLGGGVMIATVFISQQYLNVVTGKLTLLDHVSQINNYPATKYYNIRHYYADKHLARSNSTSGVSNKSKDYDMSIYIAIPLVDRKAVRDTNSMDYIKLADSLKLIPILVNGTTISEAVLPRFTRNKVKSAFILKGAKAVALYGNTAGKGVLLITLKPEYTVQEILDPPTVKEQIAPSAWLGLVYTKTISNKITTAEKDERFKAFAKDCQNDLNEASMDNFVYLNRISYGADQKELAAAIRGKGNQDSNTPNIFSPQYGSFESRMGDKLFWIFGSFIIGAAIFLIFLQFFQLRDIVDIENYKF